MQTEEESIIAEIERLIAIPAVSRDSIAYKQADNLIARVADLGKVGTQLLLNELKSGNMYFRKEEAIIDILWRLNIRVTKNLIPDEHFGYWVFDGTNWSQMIPDSIYPEFYLSLQPELEEHMTVEKWKIAVEKFERERHAEASAATLD